MGKKVMNMDKVRTSYTSIFDYSNTQSQILPFIMIQKKQLWSEGGRQSTEISQEKKII